MNQFLKNLIFSLTLFCFSLHVKGQSYACENANSVFLKKALGEWQVNTKDRVAENTYEENTGTALISHSIEGCGIAISFRGTYKSKPYARETIITGLDAQVQMVSMDSEHGGFLTYEGELTNDTLSVIWYRNKEEKKLQSKYKLYFTNSDTFYFSSFLSTDYGKSWALTHERLFERAPAKPTTNFFSIIVKNMDTSIAWYSQLLGYTVVNRNTLASRGIDIANLDNGTNRLELIQIEGSLVPDSVLEPKQKMQGFFKIGFSVKSIAPYLTKLSEMNPDFNEQTVTDPVSGSLMIVFKDPDGNRVQLFEE